MKPVVIWSGGCFLPQKIILLLRCVFFEKSLLKLYQYVQPNICEQKKAPHQEGKSLIFGFRESADRKKRQQKNVLLVVPD